MEVVAMLNDKRFFTQELSYPYRIGDIIAYSPRKHVREEPDLYVVQNSFVHVVKGGHETLHIKLVPHIPEGE